MTLGDGKTIDWSSYNKPTRFQKGGYTSTFQYGPNRSRIIKTVSSTAPGNTETSRTIYLGKRYEKVRTTKNGLTTVDHKHMITAGGKVIALHIEHQTSGLDETRYLFHDALGSVDTITDGVGNVIERMSYDPFGQRRTVGSTQNLASAAAVNLYTHRGYTGHEHVDEMGLIHMNGRVFDPTLGRFLSADPTVDGMWGVAGYNRYSYVRNNPLKYTDPSGFKKFWKQNWFKQAVVIGATILAGFYAPGLFLNSATLFQTAVIGGAAAGAAGGFVGTLVNGGSLGAALGAGLRGALYGAASGAIAGGIGHIKDLGTTLNAVRDFAGGSGKYLLHGLSQGAISAVRFGDFKGGFYGGLGAGIASAFHEAGKTLKNAFISAGIGGTAAQLGGGKFANGAISAAYVSLFNDGLTYKATARIRNLVQASIDSAGNAEIDLILKAGSSRVVFDQDGNATFISDITTVPLRR